MFLLSSTQVPLQNRLHFVSNVTALEFLSRPPLKNYNPSGIYIEHLEQEMTTVTASRKLRQ